RIARDGFGEQLFSSRYISLHRFLLKRGAAPSGGRSSDENPCDSYPRIGRARVDLQCAQHALGEMRERVERRCRQGSLDQPLRAYEVGRGRVAHSFKHAGSERVRQQALYLDGAGVENQRAFVLVDRLRKRLTRTPLVICGTIPENVI